MGKFSQSKAVHSSTRKMYLFFIRRFPDLDHFFPIIYKLAQSNNASVSILCQNLDYKLEDDFIVNFLKKEFGIPTEYSYYIDQSLLRQIILRVFLIFRRRYPRIGVRLFNHYNRFLFGEKWAAELLSKYNPAVVIMDFNRSSSLSTKVIVNTSRKRGIPVVFMTHGVTMRLSGLGQANDMASVDYNILPNRIKINYYQEKDRPVQNIKILGSPRYCEEWEKLYNRILKKTFSCPELPEIEGKIKALFFERPVIGLDSEHDAFKAAEKLDYVQAFFKERLEKKYPSYKKSGITYPSARLIQWADVVVMSISSIALEVLWQNKPLLFLKYLSPQGEVCAFDEYKACWPINSKDELIDALNILKNNPGYRPYSQHNVDKLFSDFVYNGDRANTILEDHIAFLEAISRGAEDK